MSRKQIAVTPQQDLVAIVADAPKNSELILAPGKYNLKRPLIVDKTIVMRSRTGEASDVVIERNNETVLIVTDGKPTFRGISFFAPAASNDAPINSTEHDFVEYKSAVAVRQKGRATFIGCKASSRQKSGFSARGKRARITLDKCWVFKTGEGGIFVDEQACGLVKDSLIQDTGLGCVDAESKGSALTVKNSTLARSGFASISPHDEGLIVVRNCKINVGETYGAYVADNGRLDVKSSQFFAELDDDMVVDMGSRRGVVVQSGLAELTDCVMSKLLVGVFMENDDAKIKLKRVKTVSGMIASVVYSNESPTVNFSKCDFAEELLDLDQFHQVLKSLVANGKIAQWNPRDFSEEELQFALNVKGQYCETILGKEFPHVGRPSTPFCDDGALTAYYYANSKYGGAFIVTKELVSPNFNRPSCDGVDAYELAIGSPGSFFMGKRGRKLPNSDQLFQAYKKLYWYLNEAAVYVWEDAPVAPGQTLELEGEGENERACFIFDLLDAPGTVEVDADCKDALMEYAMESKSSGDARETPSLSEALEMFDDSEQASTAYKMRRKFGVLVMIELHKSEFDYLREHEGSSKDFLAKLKEQNRWPFSDLSRPPIF